MVNQPTLLVLGAGASHVYGFPLGHVLRNRIADAINSAGHAALIAEASGKDASLVERFGRELLHARRSVDAFIESRADDYDEIGRCAIAHQLLEFENDDLLYPKLEVDWYTALFEAILGNSAEVFRGNQLRVVTFNFDRSFERALFLALQANFKGTDIREIQEVVPVLHVHGDLGYPDWFGKNSDMRRYHPGHKDVHSIRLCSGRIKIVHHQIATDTTTKIREWFSWARRILFIGFSYHELNLRKLNIPDSVDGKTAKGTILGMRGGELSRARRLTGGKIDFMQGDWTAIHAIREIDWFYEG